MPIQAPQWTDFLSCPVCRHNFTRNARPPISLGCGHTICQQCLSTLQRSQCPFDQTPFKTEPEHLPINYALLQLVGGPSADHSASSSATSSSHNSTAATTTATGQEAAAGNNNLHHSEQQNNHNNNNNNGGPKREGDPSASEIVPLSVRSLASDDSDHYKTAKECIEALALYLKPSPSNNASTNLLTRQMQRKVVALICCQLIEEEGRSRAVRAARLLGERAVTELILHHQNPQQLSANLWAAVRARGCQFLGPAMQEEVLKLVLLALEDGSALSRKVLVMFVVQRLEPVYSQASKTSIGHVVQLLYRASCFKVSKREGDSSLMQLKEEFRTYEALRREHDTQIVQIATEAGLRIAPDQWSSLLYGDTTHKSHMQSINDKLQTPESFSQSVQELVLALQRTSDPAHLSSLQPRLKYLAEIDPNAEQSVPTWQQVGQACSAVKEVVTGLADFVQHHGSRKLQEITNANPAPKYKVNMCWIFTQRGVCPRGNKCNFAHSEAELNQSKARHNNRQSTVPPSSSSSSAQMPPSMGGGGGASNGPKDDFFLLDQYGKKPLGHMPSVETSPMRFPSGANQGGGGGGMGPPQMGQMSKGSPLPPVSQNNNLMMPPQPYGGDMMMPIGPPGGVGPPPQLSHPHHHQHGHSPHHVPPSSPYASGGPPNTLHPYANSGGGPYNNSMLPSPNQLSPLGKFGFDPTKMNPNFRVSPNLGPGPPPPPPPSAVPMGGRSPRNFPGNHNAGKVGGGYNQNMFGNEMMVGPPNQQQHPPMGMNVVGPPPNMNQPAMNKQALPNMNVRNEVGGGMGNDFGVGSKNDYMAMQQQGGLGGNNNNNKGQQPFYWRKPNQMPPPSGPMPPQMQQQQNMMKSPSHMVGMGPGNMQKGHHPPPPLNKGGGGPFPGMPNSHASINDILSPRQQPMKNSPTFFGKDDLPYWGPGHHLEQMQQQQQQQQPPRNQLMVPNSPTTPAGGHPIGGPMYGVDNSSSNSRRMFDRSDSILTGEDAPFEGNATTNKFGPISRKSSSSLGTGDTMKSGGLASFDLRHQAWLNSSGQGGGSQTSPRMASLMAAAPHGAEKKASPSKESSNGMVGVGGGAGSNANHHVTQLTLPGDQLIVATANHALGGGGLWSTATGGGVGPLDAAANGAGGGLASASYVWTDKPTTTSTAAATYAMGGGGALMRDKLLLKGLQLDMEDDEKDIENGMREISKKLATELVDDDFTALT